MEAGPVNPQFTPIGHFTNFTEISYEKTRNSYDQCEIPEIRANNPLAPDARQSRPRQMGGNDREI